MLLLIVQNWHYLLFNVQPHQICIIMMHFITHLLQIVSFRFLRVAKESMNKAAAVIGAYLIISLNYNQK